MLQRQSLPCTWVAKLRIQEGWHSYCAQLFEESVILTRGVVCYVDLRWHSFNPRRDAQGGERLPEAVDNACMVELLACACKAMEQSMQRAHEATA